MFDFGRIAQSLEMVGYLMGALAIAPLFPFLYLVLRWRTRERDPTGGGTYAALLYFGSLAALLLIAGAANLTYGWMSTTEIRPFLRRLSWGLFVGGGLFLLLHLGLVRLVPDRQAMADARRIFAGFLMTIAGMVALASLVLLLIALFAPGDAEDRAKHLDDLKLYGAWAFYFLGLYLACVGVMTARIRRRG